MMPLKKTIGSRFGKLVVIEVVRNFFKRKVNGIPKFDIGLKCKCDCGREKTIRRDSLKYPGRGRGTVSCGCIMMKKSESWKYGAGFNVLYKRYTKQSKSRDLEFKLTDDEFYKIVTSNCKYCNTAPTAKTLSKRQGFRDNFLHNGVDRVDNSKGYNVDNCVPCCTVCNKMKLDYSLEFFNNHVKKIYENMENNK